MIGLLFCFIGVPMIIASIICANPKNKRGLINSNSITSPSCKPFSYEMDKNGNCSANAYTDKNGKIRYCCNPNHNHYFA